MEVASCHHTLPGCLHTVLPAMASADLRKELECSVCLSLYTDPVTLKCGHNYCRRCIDHVLETQGGSGGYSCPECREEFVERPALHRNITLHNLTEHFLSTQQSQEEMGMVCSYCVDFPVPAVKSCLLCEAFLCIKHLSFHNNSPEHVLTDPSTRFGSRKCSEHKELLKYYCTEDAACVCVSCYVIGEHRGHHMELLNKAHEKKKLELRNVLENFTALMGESQIRAQRLQERKKEIKETYDCESERVTALIRDLKRQLEDLEKRVQSKISQQAEQAWLSVCEAIRKLEMKKDQMSRKMRHIEELCNTTDPLTVLQKQDIGNTKDLEDEDSETGDVVDLDVAGISHTLHMGLSHIIEGVNRKISVQTADIQLDINTASSNVHILKDGRTAIWSSNLNGQITPARFQDYPQVLSSQSFSSGCHYWDVDVGGSRCWRVGVTYPSIARKGITSSLIGSNRKSWSLFAESGHCGVTHDGKVTWLPALISSSRVRIGLDYEAGKISFLDLCDPIRHLHTFNTTFTEPIHAALGVWDGCVKNSGQKKLRNDGKSSQ